MTGSSTSTVKWYYARVGQGQKGPVSFVQLQQLVDQKQLSAHDLVWNKDLPEWLPVNEIENLMPELPPEEKHQDVYIKQDEEETKRQAKRDKDRHYKKRGDFHTQSLPKEFAPSAGNGWAQGIGTDGHSGDATSPAAQSAEEQLKLEIDSPETSTDSSPYSLSSDQLLHAPLDPGQPARSEEVSNRVIQSAQNIRWWVGLLTLLATLGAGLGIILFIPTLLWALQLPRVGHTSLVILTYTSLFFGALTLALSGHSTGYEISQLVRVPSLAALERAFSQFLTLVRSAVLTGIFLSLTLAILWIYFVGF